MPHSNSSCAVDESIVSTPASTVTGTLILSIVFLLGFPGNLFVIWTILARARKQSVTTLLILNLALADGSLMALTPFFIAYLAFMNWKMGTVMCKVLFYLCLANMYASIYLIMLMSIYRLVSIVWPQRISVITGKRTITRVLAVMWLFVMVASIPALIYRDARRNKENRTVCDSFHDKDPDVSLDNPFFIFSSVNTYELYLIPPFFCPLCPRQFCSTCWRMFWASWYPTESFWSVTFASSDESGRPDSAAGSAAKSSFWPSW